jgi:hypothetical protein
LIAVVAVVPVLEVQAVRLPAVAVVAYRQQALAVELLEAVLSRDMRSSLDSDC